MFYLPITDTTHLDLDLCAEQDTAALLLAALKSEPRQIGCYVFLNLKQPLYVGRSEQLYDRLYRHLTKTRIERKIGDWTTLGIIFSDTPHLLEKSLIRQLQPTFNVK